MNILRGAHYHLVNSVVKLLQKIGLSAGGAIIGMLGHEPDTLLYAAKDTYWDFRKEPSQYGLDILRSEIDFTKRPVLLIHGAAGSWNYMGPLATGLMERNYTVFVLNLGMGMPSQDKKELLLSKIDSIMKLYIDRRFMLSSVDLIAHSMGASTALAAVLSSESTVIENGTVCASHEGTLSANANVGKLITLANPSDASDLSLLARASKDSDTFNIIAKYDVLMSHKVPTLNKSQIIELDSKHVNIVYHKEVVNSICHFLEL